MPEIERTSPSVTPLLLVRLTFEKWYADNMPRHAAALAYYTMFAVAPLLVIVVAIAGFIYGREAAQGKIAAQVDHYINSPPTAALIQSMLISLNQSSSNLIITILSVVALIYGASNVFGELQITLNQIWHAPRKTNDGFLGIILQRLLAIGMVLVSGLVLFFSLVLSTWITAANQWAALRFALLPEYDEWSYFLLLLGITTVIFALIYRFVPDVRKPWHDVIIGAIATALLFSIARLLLGWYLSYTSVASTYGAAGSQVLLLLWVYYSAQIFLLGAEFTQVYGQLYNTPEASPTPAEAPASTRPEQIPLTVPEPIITQVAKNPAVITISAPDEPSADLGIAPDAPQEPPTEAPAKPSRWGRVRALGQFWGTARKLPFRMTRPLGEIALAAGVIGAASIAALLLGPLRRRSEEEE